MNPTVRALLARATLSLSSSPLAGAIEANFEFAVAANASGVRTAVVPGSSAVVATRH